MKRWWSWSYWAEPVDNAPLVLFRAVFGLLCFLESAGSIATGWVKETYAGPAYTFPHIGFAWLSALSGPAMYGYYALMSVPALLVMLGAFYRPALAVFSLMWAGVYFGQTASYNNHYYLLLLLCLLLLATPAAADASCDSLRGRVVRSAFCPRWCIGMLVAQIAIVYFYASFAKLDADWLAARPIAIWFRAKQHYPVLGALYAQEWFHYFVAYGGILFDGLVVPLLLWSRTRWLGVALSVIFHVFNSITFQIGIFPYLGISFCLLFFPGEPIRRYLRTTRWARFFADGNERAAPVAPLPMVAALVLIAYFGLQLALPLRHFLYPGNVHWSEEGHRMAWHMMLRTKAGAVTMRVVDRESGEQWRVRPSDMLSDKQARRIAGRPDMLWRFARILRRRYAAEGRDVAVFADTRVSLNGHPSRRLVDPEVDLSRADWPWIRPLPWILHTAPERK